MKLEQKTTPEINDEENDVDLFGSESEVNFKIFISLFNIN